MRWLILSVCFVALCVQPTALRAQPNPNAGLARKHYELGERLYQLSNHREALVEFGKAYKLAPLPGMLFNIARCHEVLGDLEQAIKHYQLYLDQLPKAKNRDLVQGRMANLKLRLAERRKPKPPLTPQTKPVKPAVVAPAQPPGQRSWRAPLGWSAVGVGGATLVAGLIFGGLAASKSSEFDDGVTAELPYDELAEIDDTGKTFQAAQVALLVTGGVLAAVGGGLLLWEHLGGERQPADGASATLAPVVGPGQVGLMGVVRF